MAKQTFTTGQVLSAAQVNTLQANDYNTTVSTKIASYVLVAADVGTTIVQNVATANTVTVNTGLFAAGDTLRIQNIGAGIATVTAGTATVNTANSLGLPQWGSGILYFTSTSAAIFFPSAGAAAAGGGKVLQVVFANTTTVVSSATTSFVDTTLTATITPTLNTSKVLVFISQNGLYKNSLDSQNALTLKLMRGSTDLAFLGTELNYQNAAQKHNSSGAPLSWLDEPATTSATTYKTRFMSTYNTGTVEVQSAKGGTTVNSTIILMEIGA
jgi:hypothetical protein